MWKDFWALSRNEQRGFLTLFVLLVVAMGSLVGVSILSTPRMQCRVVKAEPPKAPDIIDLQGLDVEPGSLNPNDITIKQLETLGFNTRAILNWKKYIEAGGRYDSPDDIFAVRGVDSASVARLLPYLCFNKTTRPKYHGTSFKEYTPKVYVDLNTVSIDELHALGVPKALGDSIIIRRKGYFATRRLTVDELSGSSIDSAMALIRKVSSPIRQKTVTPDFVLELNSTDTTELKLLKGIGPAYARRIVYFRQRLGGFRSVNQLLEVEGISPDLLDNIRPFLSVDAARIKPLCVNKESLRKLKEHPYIGFYKAKDIVDLRKKNGNITSISQVLALPSFQQCDKQLIASYLSID